jgi:hypothetical protein
VQERPTLVLGSGAILLAVLLALAMPAAAYDEADAGLLRPDMVLSAGHLPTRVPAHTQWQGILTLRPGNHVLSAQYQVCRVGQACFAPPAPAQRHGDTFVFDTANYTAGGRSVDYQAGWRIGVQWLLTEDAGMNETRTETFPEGRDLSGAGCAADPLGCQETHYIAFDMEPAAHAAPGAAVLPVAALLLGAAGARRRHA